MLEMKGALTLSKCDIAADETADATSDEKVIVYYVSFINE